MRAVTPPSHVQAAIRALYAYDPATGVVTKAGRPVGWPTNTGYLAATVTVGSWRRNLRIQRMAWFLQTGEWPPDEMDVEHENRRRADNRWANLSLKSRAQNLWNSSAHRDGGTGVKGATWCRFTQKYRVRIMRRGRNVELGRYPTLAEARAAYERAGGIP